MHNDFSLSFAAIPGKKGVSGKNGHCVTFAVVYVIMCIQGFLVFVNIAGLFSLVYSYVTFQPVDFLGGRSV